MSFILKQPTASQTSRGNTFDSKSIMGLPIGSMDGIAASDVLTWDGTDWVFGTGSSGLTCVDATVDGIGSLSGSYATLALAVASGARNICVVASYTEPTTVIGTGVICVTIGTGISITFDAITLFSGFEAIEIKGCGYNPTQSEILITNATTFCLGSTKLFITDCYILNSNIAGIDMTEGRVQMRSCIVSGFTLRFPTIEIVLVANNFSVSVSLFPDSFDLSNNTFISSNKFTAVVFVSPLVGDRTGVIFSNNLVGSTFESSLD